MQTLAKVLGVFAFVLLFLPSVASAQASRTWVSGVGDDNNPCSRTFPCKTFNGAQPKTAAGGEINCLDSGGFNPVTITKSLTIKCDGVIGGAIVTGTSGITINAASTDSIHLSGLDLQGLGQGLRGVSIVNAGSVQIERSFIRGFRAAPGIGIDVSSTSPVSVEISDVTISNSSGPAVSVTAPGGAKVAMDRVRLVDNQTGLRVDATAPTTGLSATLTDSIVTNSANVAVNAATAAGRASTITIQGSTISYNARALKANGAGAVVRVGDSILTGNTALTTPQGGASIVSYGTNQVEENVTGQGALGTGTLQ